MKRRICLLLGLAVAISAIAVTPTPISASGPTSISQIVEHQPLNESEVDQAAYTKIFLAGTIDMGNSIDWQRQTIDLFRQRSSGRYLFFNPRRGGKFEATPENMNLQVRWELDRLERADLIVMNLLGTSKSPISLLEMGIHIRSGKLRVACEPDYYRHDNVRITCEKYGVPFYNSLTELLDDCFGPKHTSAPQK